MDSFSTDPDLNINSSFARGLFPEVFFQTPGPATPQAQRVTISQPSSSMHRNAPRPQPGPHTSSESGDTGRDRGEQDKDELCQLLAAEGLSDDNIAKIISNGFTSIKLFRLLKAADIDSMNISPLAQRRLMESFLDKASAPVNPTLPQQRQASTSSNPTPHEVPTDLTAAAINSLRQLFSSTKASNTNTSSGEQIVTSCRVKCLDICDFLRHEPVRERIVLGDGDEQVLIRSGGSKPRLDQTSPLQWMGASIRILHELVARGDLSTDGITSYLSYMEKISDLASKYTWQSLLVYDREYRRWQAQTNCVWGADNIHLFEVYLDARPRQASSNVKMHPNNPKRAPFRSQHEVCRLYNAGKCHWGSDCKFRHACSAPGCNEKHPVRDHDRYTDTTPKNGQRG